MHKAAAMAMTETGRLSSVQTKQMKANGPERTSRVRARFADRNEDILHRLLYAIAWRNGAFASGRIECVHEGILCLL